ncbi:M24 family metallopeptidase [Martelella sp. AMO21009]
MQVHIDFQKRLARFQSMLREQGVDVLVGTRLKTVTHISGAFVPWRSVVIVPAEGEVQLVTVNMDAPRILAEGWLENVAGYGRHSMFEMAVRRIRELGLHTGRVAVEDGYSWYLPEGMITKHEYTTLEAALPEAELTNLTKPIDHLMLIKEPEQIALMRQATAITDAAQEAVRRSAHPGMAETEIAGIAEQAARDLGSEFAWTFTGGQEIASGHRTWTGACTPSTRKVVQRGEFLLVDLHAMYEMMLGDVSHNAIMGKPTAEQQKLIDAYVESCHYLTAALKPGRTIGDVAGDVRRFTVEKGWDDMIRGFGHGIGAFGNEWYPSFTDFAMEYVSEPDYVMQPGFMEIIALTCNLPGVGGLRYERAWVITENGAECMSKTPIEPWVYEG